MKLKIKNAELVSDILGKVDEFPKYTTQLINLSNQNAQGTKPKVVGQMSDLIKEFEGNRCLSSILSHFWFNDFITSRLFSFRLAPTPPHKRVRIGRFIKTTGP